MAKKSEPKPWQRVEPGRYRSADGRFTIDQGDPGRWFVIDEAEHDDFGQPRTLGPFSSLADARSAADAARSAPPAESPLKAKLAEAAKRPQSPSQSKAARPDRRTRIKAEPEPEPAPPPPPPPTWLDALPADRATRARRLIDILEGLGVDDAERLVRRDIQTNEPAVVEALLGRFVHSRAVEPWGSEAGLERFGREKPKLARALEVARRAGLDETEIGSLAQEIAASAVSTALEAVSAFDRVPGSDGELPGWQLVEQGGSDRPRRVRLG